MTRTLAVTRQELVDLHRRAPRTAAGERERWRRVGECVCERDREAVDHPLDTAVVGGAAAVGARLRY